MKIKVCKSFVEPDDVPILSSKNDGVYYVTPASPYNDAVCECAGYIYRGYCRHITEIEEQRCRWLTSDWRDPIEACPNCGGKTVIFNTEPAYFGKN